MKTPAAFLTLLLAVIYAPTSTEAVCDATGTATAGDTTTASITEIICDPISASVFGTLCSHLQTTGLGTTLSRSSTADFFLFAPTDSAFTNARSTAGVTTHQITNMLKYHVSADSTDVTCNAVRSSLLTINGNIKNTTTRCDSTGTTLLGQTGVVRTPRPSSPFPNFVTPTTGSDSAITACNGRIRVIDQVLGFGPAIYNFGSYAPCSFYSKSCKGAKGYPKIKVSEQTLGDLTFDNIGYNYPKAAKKAKPKNGAWYGFQPQLQAPNSTIPEVPTHPGLAYLYNKFFSPTTKSSKAGKADKADKKNKGGYYYGGSNGKAGKYAKRYLRGESNVDSSPYDPDPEEVEYEDYYQ